MDKIKKEEKEKEDEIRKEIPSVRIENIKMTIYQLYKYLEEIEVKGHENAKKLNNIFNSFLQITEFLEELKEDVMNLEGKEMVKK